MKLFLKNETVHNVRVGDDLTDMRIITAEFNIQDVHELGTAIGVRWLDDLRRQMVPGRRLRDPQAPT